MQSKVWSQFSAYDTSQWVQEGQLQFCPMIWAMFNLTRRTCIYSPVAYMWNIITLLENASGESESCRQRRTSGTNAMVAWCLYSCRKLATSVSQSDNQNDFFSTFVPVSVQGMDREWPVVGAASVQHSSHSTGCRQSPGVYNCALIIITVQYIPIFYWVDQY